jgi:hypothetical protein
LFYALFLFNYFKNSEGKPSFYLFQAIYFFKTEEAKNRRYETIRTLISKFSVPVTYTDLASSSYLRYNLPCGSGINLKQGKHPSGHFVIDILWVSDSKK